MSGKAEKKALHAGTSQSPAVTNLYLAALALMLRYDDHTKLAIATLVFLCAVRLISVLEDKILLFVDANQISCDYAAVQKLHL